MKVLRKNAEIYALRNDVNVTRSSHHHHIIIPVSSFIIMHQQEKASLSIDGQTKLIMISLTRLVTF
jgi:hypothetical protein